MNRRKLATVVYVLLALSLLAFAAATPIIVNVTEWTVRADTPPIVKLKGDDADNNFVTVTWQVDSTSGYNVTKITIKGFRGDITKYTSVIKILNKHPSKTFNVKLSYQGSTGDWTYVKYVRVWIASESNYIEITSTSTPPLETGAVALAPGATVDVGVEVVIDGSLPDALLGQDLVTLVIHVVAQEA